MRIHVPSRRCRAGLAVIAAAALASASLAAAVVAAAPASAASAATPRCTVPSLKGSFTHPSATSAQRFITLALTNASRRACSLSGFPAAQLLSASGRRIPTHVVQARGSKPKTIVLRPGQSGRSAWRYSVLAAQGEPTVGTCAATPSKIDVTPPHATDHLVLRWRGSQVCNRGSITVRAMTR
ncbi:MAG TPA: DUF4232 domain-containing protein [Conexibacter sp.]|jgi:hypothetical protein